jgi:plasmid stabilization system protein ParE
LAEIHFRARAEDDLDSIRIFSLAEFGRETTLAYLDSFDDVWTLLGRHPYAGGVFRKGRVTVRTYPCRSHRIFYLVEGERVWILRILHSSMNHDMIMRKPSN